MEYNFLLHLQYYFVFKFLLHDTEKNIENVRCLRTNYCKNYFLAYFLTDGSPIEKSPI